MRRRLPPSRSKWRRTCLPPVPCASRITPRLPAHPTTHPPRLHHITRQWASTACTPAACALACPLTPPLTCPPSFTTPPPPTQSVVDLNGPAWEAAVLVGFLLAFRVAVYYALRAKTQR